MRQLCGVQFRQDCQNLSQHSWNAYTALSNCAMLPVMNMRISICIKPGDIEQQSFGYSADFRVSIGMIYEGSEYKFPVKTHHDSV